jgi:Flp pilus assembly pilin Flp
MKKLIAFIKDEDGLETSEYAVMGALIVLALIASVTAMRNSIAAVFNGISTTITVP